METEISVYCCKKNYTFVPIPSESIETIYNLLFNNKISEPETDIEMLYYGLYNKIRSDDEKAIKYFQMAIEHGNRYAMFNMAVICKDLDDLVNMKKYYLMATGKGLIQAWNQLKQYYKEYDVVEYFVQNNNYEGFENILGIILTENHAPCEKIVEYLAKYGHYLSDKCHPMIKLLYNATQEIDLTELQCNFTEPYKGCEEAICAYLEAIATI